MSALGAREAMAGGSGAGKGQGGWSVVLRLFRPIRVCSVGMAIKRFVNQRRVALDLLETKTAGTLPACREPCKPRPVEALHLACGRLSLFRSSLLQILVT